MSTSTYLPIFPEFTSLKPHHQAILSEAIKANRLYSDFNFVSLWSWDHQNKLQISTLNNNLIIKFQNYTDASDYFYSFFGTNHIDETAITLLRHSHQEGIERLRLIPQFVVEKLKEPEHFIILEDRDSFDYIMAVNDMVELKNKKNASKRRNLNKFTRHYGDSLLVRELDIKDPRVANQILTVARRWSSQINSRQLYEENEGRAIAKIVGEHHTLNTSNLHILGLYLDDDLKAFSISEILGDGFAMGHYKKADRMFSGLGVALDYYTAKTLQTKGVSHLNHEQDLGIEGLRAAKLASNPVYFLKKFTVALKSHGHDEAIIS